jgi:hypothetical protein
MNFGKILLLLAVLSTAVIIYLNAPPRGTAVFFIILLLLASPFLYYFWTFRGEMLLMSGRTKIFTMIALAIMLVFAAWWYKNQYDRHVYISEEDPAAYLYFPLQENEVLSEMLKKGGGTLEGSVERLGFEVVKKEIANNTTKSDYLVTDAYFILVAILAYLSLFLFLIFLYLEVWVKNVFQLPNLAIQSRKELWKLVRKDQLEDVLDQLSRPEGQVSSKTLKAAAAMDETLKELEKKRSQDAISPEDYLRQRNGLQWRLLNLVS